MTGPAPWGASAAGRDSPAGTAADHAPRGEYYLDRVCVFVACVHVCICVCVCASLCVCVRSVCARLVAWSARLLCPERGFRGSVPKLYSFLLGGPCAVFIVRFLSLCTSGSRALKAQFPAPCSSVHQAPTPFRGTACAVHVQPVTTAHRERHPWGTPAPLCAHRTLRAPQAPPPTWSSPAPMGKPLLFFLLIRRSHSISFTRAQSR